MAKNWITDPVIEGSNLATTRHEGKWERKKFNITGQEWQHTSRELDY